MVVGGENIEVVVVEAADLFAWIDSDSIRQWRHVPGGGGQYLEEAVVGFVDGQYLKETIQSLHFESRVPNVR